jgi:16S rRNA (uracil1498-N3)-methyltransferase
MRIARFFCSNTVTVNSVFELDESISNHILRVLRLKPQDRIILFDGYDQEFLAEIINTNQKIAIVKILEAYSSSLESPVNIHLLQGIARGEKMDFIIQKTTELGVNEITPLFTQHCSVKLNAQKAENKVAHWQKVVINACEQCGRNQVPKINIPQTLEQWLAANRGDNRLRLILSPNGNLSLKSLACENKMESNCSRRSLACENFESHSRGSGNLDPHLREDDTVYKSASCHFRGSGNLTEITLLIGPEGGLSEDEIALCAKYNFHEVKLGPRILRTETAALAAISAIQAIYGDFGV